jgi:hypothetical protein
MYTCRKSQYRCLLFDILSSLFYSGESAAEETAIGLKIGEEDQRLENEKVSQKCSVAESNPGSASNR